METLFSVVLDDLTPFQEFTSSIEIPPLEFSSSEKPDKKTAAANPIYRFKT